MQEVINTEKFIQCVELHPDLWEKNSKYYKDRNVRETNWDSIGNQIFPNWSEFNEDEVQEKIKFMKSKWRNIRDSYMRCLQTERKENKPGKRKKYIYEDYLSFLLKTTRRRRGGTKRKAENEANISQASRDEFDDELDTLLIPKNEVEDEIEIDEPDLLGLLPKTQAFETFPTSSHFKLNKPDRNELEEDADRSFLISLLPDMRRLNDGQRLDFRFHCLQFFRDLRQRSGVESNYSYNSST